MSAYFIAIRVSKGNNVLLLVCVLLLAAYCDAKVYQMLDPSRTRLLQSQKRVNVRAAVREHTFVLAPALDARILTSRRTRLRRRSISNAVIETANCEHIDLVDCDEYETSEMTCMVTATGMPCCLCSGKLKSLNKRRDWSSFW